MAGIIEYLILLAFCGKSWRMILRLAGQGRRKAALLPVAAGVLLGLLWDPVKALLPIGPEPFGGVTGVHFLAISVFLLLVYFYKIRKG